MRDDFRNFWLPLITATLFLVVLALNTPCCFGAETEIDAEWYVKYAQELGLPEDFCDRAGLEFSEVSISQTWEIDANPAIVTDRSGFTVEEIVGFCAGKGNGIVLNGTYDAYISYKNLDIQKGDIVITFCLYNPEGKSIDDIIWREDYVIDTDQLIED